MSTAKFCPFCGHVPAVDEHEGKVHCSNVKCSIFLLKYMPLEAWNQRAEHSAIDLLNALKQWHKGLSGQPNVANDVKQGMAKVLGQATSWVNKHVRRI